LSRRAMALLFALKDHIAPKQNGAGKSRAVN
jgi:hypothetical protein